MAALELLGGIHLQPKWSTAFALWTIPRCCGSCRACSGR